MATMIAKYDKTELCHLMGIGYAGFLEDNQELSIPCPTLLIVGEKDTTGKVKAYNREWSKRTGFRLVWIADSAHNSNVDNPVTVNKQIAAFLNTLR
ncbi:alpha/beta fold hydrolase [Streptococcus gallolyticus]|nr:alpha/beta hydrolase [Streptococcus gallolyticus]MCY7184905.1 alpha/beta hydrolase [Streptococcus gallolyticus subsp. gallolyticus]MCY7189990.1 alpha/beta hydrolase [Streptococcus gallolyticus subsp. gallolyticus]